MRLPFFANACASRVSFATGFLGAFAQGHPQSCVQECVGLGERQNGGFRWTRPVFKPVLESGLIQWDLRPAEKG